MKKYIIFMVILILLMTFIPFATIKNRENFSPIDTNINSEKYLCELVAKEYRKEYSLDTLKALAIILETNISAKENTKVEALDKNAFVKLYGNKGEAYYQKIEKAVGEVYGNKIYQNDKIAYIPYCYVATENHKTKYSYIKDVATPWDNLNENYKDKNSTGISINSINQLCNSGLNYKKALEYFIANIKIAP